jgi:hypothetical protein
MQITIRRGPRRLAAAALAALGLAGQAEAQYAPYAQPQTQYVGAVTPYAPVQASSPYNSYGVQAQTPPQYAAQGAYQGYAAAQQTQQTAFTQSPAAYANPYAAPRTAMAFQGPTPAVGPEGMPAGAGETPTLTAPMETVPAGAAQNGGYVPMQPTPSSENYGYGPNPTPTPAYGGGYESYPANGGAGCATGNCGTGYNPSGYGGYGGACNVTPYGACDTYSTYGGMEGCLSKHAGCGYWFGGAYALLMDRDNSNKYALSFTAPAMPAESYPPFPPTIVLDTRDVDVGFQPGVEFRLGRTFGCAPVDPCNPCCGTCGPRWGVEFGFWTLFEDDDWAQYQDQGGIRTYTMMPMYGLQYNNGLGYRPVNEYWDHAPPSPATTDIEVRTVRVSSSFEVYNAEVNLLRLGVCGGGCGPAMCDVACGPSACGGCDSGYGACGADACATGCAPCAPRGPRYSCTGVCGFRWLQINEGFMFGVDFDNTGTPDPLDGNLDYYADVENNLFGGQIGCNGMYRIGCKWGLHLNSAFGLYGNDIDVRQYFRSPTNDVIYTVTGEDFDVRAYKTDVSMLGELRLGVSYQCTCKCRVYGGWRAIGITGLALATEQTPVAFTSASQMSQYVNSNGSMIIHGLQTGVEFNY